MANFLRGLKEYPYVGNSREAVENLRRPFTRAVLGQHPDLFFDASAITDIPGMNKAPDYWRTQNRVKPGQITYYFDPKTRHSTLTRESIEMESMEAGVAIRSDAIDGLHRKMNLAMSMFSEVYANFDSRPFKMRGWQMWAPIGGQGRTPVLHVDKSKLTATWYAARPGMELFTGPIPNHIWGMLLSREKRNTRNDDILREFADKADPRHFVEVPCGPLIIAVNGHFKPENDPALRNKASVHRSSPRILQAGQAGLVMVPEAIR